MGKRGPKAKPPEQRFRALVDASAGPHGCHPWLGHRHLGKNHGQFNRGNHVIVYAHRYALELHLGRPLLDGMHALHKPVICHTPFCCNPLHLYEGNDVNNTGDKQLDGTMPKGETHWGAKLCETDIPVILALFWWSGFKDWEIAEAFSISRQAISAIAHGRHWAHVLCSARP